MISGEYGVGRKDVDMEDQARYANYVGLSSLMGFIPKGLDNVL